MAEFLTSLFSSTHVAIAMLLCLLAGGAWLARRLMAAARWAGERILGEDGILERRDGRIEQFGQDVLNMLKNTLDVKQDLARLNASHESLCKEVAETKEEVKSLRNDLPHLAERVSSLEAKVAT